MVLCFWLAGLAVFCFVVASEGEIDPPKADAIIVLTGAPGRIEKALDLFALEKSGDVFISGVYPSVSMEDIRAKSPSILPDCCITLGYQATSTEENGVEVEKWLHGSDFRSVILVTSAYHMPRARVELGFLKEMGIEVHPVTVYDAAAPSRKDFAKLILSEYHKTLYRWIQIHVLGR